MTMTKKKQGRNTTSAASVAPAGPAIRYPMKATVMTTGPGVIIATATASRNCCSESQLSWLTTPPCRNGTIARPLPNTKAPASAKYQKIFQNSVSGVGPCRPVVSHRGIAVNTVALGNERARRTKTSTPDSKNSQTISDSVHAVTTALIPNIVHTNSSLPNVREQVFVRFWQ